MQGILNSVCRAFICSYLLLDLDYVFSLTLVHIAIVFTTSTCRDDPELDNMLKDGRRGGDPMAHLVKKKHYEPVLRDLGDAEKMKELGFLVPEDIPEYSWILRKLDAAPNRYGFEKKMFTNLNEKRAT
ncbi:hypothetical protein REPUB_Repub16aG0132300 [Reevesia pubescens]